VCGIIGFVGRGLTIQKDEFLQLRDLLAHRGPDDAGVWESTDGNAMLGHRRLAILDLSSTGHQPMVSAQGDVAIVFNGEIYNYLELKEELKAAGCRFRSASDTEVLLLGYETWGTSLLEKLNGMFAFAIWDSRRQRLFAARDRFGEKPFYYCTGHRRDGLFFASEIKSLVHSPVIAKCCENARALYRCLSYYQIDECDETMFEGVSSLPAAHALLYTPHDPAPTIWRYWDLCPDKQIRMKNDNEYAEQLLALLADSVRIRLRSDVIVGSSLSGGLDSSTIVGLVARISGKGNQKTFSARFDDARYDEGKHIQRIVEWTGAESHTVYPNPEQLPGEMERLTWHQEQPFFSTSIFAQWNVMRLAKEHGVVVLLDGQGADEIFAGYHLYFTHYYRTLFQNLRWAELVHAIYDYGKVHSLVQWPVLVYEFLPWYLQRLCKEWKRPGGIRKEFEQRYFTPPETVPKRYATPLEERLYESLVSTHLPTLLRYADRNSMAFSREVRLPFLDHRVVEFLFSIPYDQKIRRSMTKVALRECLRGVVPEEIRLRHDKLGFATPEVKWLRGPLRSWAEDILGSKRCKEREWIDSAVMEKVWHRFMSGLDENYTIIWRWLSLEVWARVFLDADSSYGGRNRASHGV